MRVRPLLATLHQISTRGIFGLQQTEYNGSAKRRMRPVCPVKGKLLFSLKADCLSLAERTMPQVRKRPTRHTGCASRIGSAHPDIGPKSTGTTQQAGDREIILLSSCMEVQLSPSEARETLEICWMCRSMMLFSHR